MSKDLIFLPGLKDIAGQYDAILCDVWGVIHNGREGFDAACDALVRFRAGGGRVCLITNAPVPKAQVLRYFKPLGIPDAAFDDCVSSGDATRAVLLQHRDVPIWRLGSDGGWEHDRHLFEGLDLNFVERADEAKLGLLVGLRDQERDNPEDYQGELAEVADTGLTLVCANPDIQVRVGDRLVWCAGALARIYERLGGEVIYPGKPHAAIYDLARDRLSKLGPLATNDRILAIGDGPITDIAGANREGIDALYVGSGLAQYEPEVFQQETIRFLRGEGVRARYAQAALRW
ncbi:MAG: TIGR01459 family HAD-type hydrolase [Pseudomonadota bacterium]